MANKWVDSQGYFGPDRRKRSGRKLWNERRTLDEAGDLPPLGVMLRRLRVQMLGVESGDDHAHTLQMLSAAISEAQRLHYADCANALHVADRLLRTHGPRGAAQAEPHIAAAIEHASHRR